MITLHSSHGTIIVREDGTPYSETLPPEYQEVAQFDVKRLERFCVSNHIPFPKNWDILGMGYWTHEGNYEEPAPDYCETGFMRFVWRGEADDAYEAMEMNGDLE